MSPTVIGFSICVLILSSQIEWSNQQPTLIREPEDTAANVGEDVTLYYEIDNLPTPHTVRWYVWRTDLTQWLRISINSTEESYIPTQHPNYSITGTYNLRINTVVEQDYTKFKCENTEGIKSMEVYIRRPVAPDSPPTISSSIDLSNIKSGDTLQLTCSSTGGVEAPTVKWYLGSTEITDTSKVNYQPNTKWAISPSDASRNVLTLKLTLDDNGKTYECRVKNKALTVHQAVSRTLNVKFAPQSVKIGPDHSPYKVIKGEDATFTCTSDGNPSPTSYTWKRDNVQRQATTVNTWTNTNVQESTDVGAYTCTASNNIGDPKLSKNSVQLDVLYPPTITNLQDNYIYNEKDPPLLIKCEANANPNDITYTWTRGSTVSNGATLTIRNRTERGDYTCKAKNNMQPSIGGSQPGEDTKKINVDVYYKPGRAVAENAEVNVNANQPATLRCSHPTERGNPISSFKWSKGPSSTPLVGETSTSLTINRATVKDNDDAYKCTPTNEAGDGTPASIVLTVRAAPSIDDHPSGKIDVVNSDSTLPSSLKCVDRARPGSEYKWYLDNNEITNDHNIYAFDDSPSTPDKWTTTSSSLKWKDSSTVEQRRDGSGSVKCKATNPAGHDEKSFSINVQYKPYNVRLSPSSDTITKVENDTLQNIKCESTSNPTSRYAWVFNSTTERGTSDTLVLGKLDRSHHGSYKCTASNDVGYDTVEFFLVVEYPSNVTSFTSSTDLEPIMEESEFSLTCHADSRPASDIEIYLESTKVKEASETLTLVHTVPKATCRHMGMYSCDASNGRGSGNSVLERFVTVYCSPTDDDSKTKTSAKIGDTAAVVFNNIGFPVPTFQWYQLGVDDTRLPLPSHISTYVNTTNNYKHYAVMSIKGVKETDFGKYICIASNTVGNTTKIFELNATGPPEKPSNVKVIELRTAVSLYIQWTHGYHNGKPQTFIVEYQKVRETKWTEYRKDIIDPPPLPLKVHPLDSNTSYVFRVNAINAEGPSGFSEPSGVGATWVLPKDYEVNPSLIRDGKNIIVKFTNFPRNCTSVTIYCCEVQNVSSCIMRNITDLRETPKQVVIATEDGKKYTVVFSYYQQDDIVHQSQPQIARPKSESPNVGGIVGGVLGGVLLAALVVVIIGFILWKRRQNGETGKNSTEMNTRRSLIIDQGSGHSNESFVDGNPYAEPPGTIGNEEINPYGETLANRHTGNGSTNNINPYGELGEDINPNGVTIAGNGNINERPIDVENNVERSKFDPAALYAEPDKTKKNKKQEKTAADIAGLYAQPDKVKKGGKKDNKDMSDPVEGLYAQPDKTKKNKKGEKTHQMGALYAEPDKTKKKKNSKDTKPVEALYAEPDKKKNKADIPTVAQPADPIYAESEKKKKDIKPTLAKKPAADKPNVANKPNIKAKPTIKKPPTPTKPDLQTKQHPYVNVQNTAAQHEGEYAEVRNPKKAFPDGENPYANASSIPEGENPYANSGSIPDGENTYSNSGHIPAGDNPYQNWELPNTEPNPPPSPPPNPDNPALLYADLSFTQNQNDESQQASAPVRQEEPTEYAAIDFKRTGKGINA